MSAVDFLVDRVLFAVGWIAIYLLTITFSKFHRDAALLRPEQDMKRKILRSLLHVVFPSVLLLYLSKKLIVWGYLFDGTIHLPFYNLWTHCLVTGFFLALIGISIPSYTSSLSWKQRWPTIPLLMTAIFLFSTSLSSSLYLDLRRGDGFNSIGNDRSQVVGWEAVNDTFSSISLEYRYYEGSQKYSYDYHCATTLIANCTYLEGDNWDSNAASWESKTKTMAWFEDNSGDGADVSTFCSDGPDNLNIELPINVVNMAWNTYTCNATWETPYLFWVDEKTKLYKSGMLGQKSVYLLCLSLFFGMISALIRHYGLDSHSSLEASHTYVNGYEEMPNLMLPATAFDETTGRNSDDQDNDASKDMIRRAI